MNKRTPEQFFKEEGMTIDTARRIYENMVYFILNNTHIGCMREISNMKIIKDCFTCGTDHAGGTSARQFLTDIDEEPFGSIELDSCDTEFCDHIDCCMRCECEKYKNAKEEEEEDGEDDC